MGQDHSTQTRREVTPEQISQQLALKFATKCYSELELYCFKQVFRNLAETQDGVRFWPEATLCRFLELPDVLGAGPVLFQMTTYLGVFPCSSLAPGIVNMEAMLTTVTLMTERYKAVLKRGEKDRNRLLYASLAVFDKQADDALTDEEALQETLKGVRGFSIDKPRENTIEEDDEDSLTLAALDELDAIGALGLADQPAMRHSIIPADNFLRLVELLLLIAPLAEQESVTAHSEQLTASNLEILRQVANSILASFGVEERPGITYKAFNTVIPNSLPYIFQGFHPLFEHFLFQKEATKATAKDDSSTSKTTTPAKVLPPLLPDTGEILNRTVLSQLSFFIPPKDLFRRLHHLYSGNAHGFSLQSFEKHVMNWRAPTILLVTGTLIPANPTNSRERSFVDSMPPKRYPNSTTGTQVTYGVYLTTPWKQTHKSHFGDSNTTLFQLSPIHDVFRASSVSQDYGSYTTPSGASPHAGINFGSPLPMTAGSKASAHGGTSSQHVPLGPVSLYLDASLEFGVFTHIASGGGSFHPSISPARTRQSSKAPQQPGDYSTTAASGPAARRRSRGNSLASMSPTSPTTPHTSTSHPASHSVSATNLTSPPSVNSSGGINFQDRFEIDSLEVWGCGGDEEEARRRKRIEDEEREARMRREQIAKTGDGDANYALLEMAGLVGHGREGGSMG